MSICYNQRIKLLLDSILHLQNDIYVLSAIALEQLEESLTQTNWNYVIHISQIWFELKLRYIKHQRRGSEERAGNLLICWQVILWKSESCTILELIKSDWHCDKLMKCRGSNASYLTWVGPCAHGEWVFGS